MTQKHHISFLIFLIVFCWTQRTQAQSLKLSLNDLTFHSGFEKDCFHALEIDSGFKNMFFLSLAHEKSMTREKAEELYAAFLKPQERILISKIKKGKPKTINRYLYQTIHDIYLKKYVSNTTFSELLDYGVYNCVSSSILYALIFEKQGIPYTIKRMPEHVYLIAFPDSKKPVKVETTDPVNGFVFFNAFLKETYVRNLLKDNVITEWEFKTYSKEDLFTKYFYNDNEINLIELIALQYLNFYSKEDNRASLALAEKAYYLLPEKKYESVISSSLTLAFQSNNLETIEDIRIYVKAINYNLNTLTNEQKLNEFRRLTQRLLFDNPNENFYHEVYFYLKTNIESEEWAQKISAIYYSELSRKKLAFTTDHTKALEYGLQALNLYPISIENQRLVYHSFNESIKTENPDTSFKRLLQLLEDYPHLLDNKMFSELKGTLILKKIQWSFQFQKPEIGLQSLNEFENFMTSYPNIKLNQLLITKAFSEVAIYYFRLGDTNKSIGVIEKGLEYAPTSYELKNRLTQLSQ